jgi:hypothetical protein
MTHTKKRMLVVAVVIAAGFLLAAATSKHDQEARAVEGSDTASISSNTLADRFARLSHAHSNRCSLSASGLNAMPRGKRLQGACCGPMNYHSYVKQVRGLRSYAGVAVIPKDPYDVPVGLARHLVSYHNTITLSPGQRKVYNRAAKLSDEKGPCCCQCWRWTAFAGQGKYLITHRGYSAQGVSKVWDLEDGCGDQSSGSMSAGTRTSMPP